MVTVLNTPYGVELAMHEYTPGPTFTTTLTPSPMFWATFRASWMVEQGVEGDAPHDSEDGRGDGAAALTYSTTSSRVLAVVVER